MGIKPTYEELEQGVKALEKSEEGLNREERQLISRDTLFRAITEQSGEGISLADSEGNYVFINPAFCKMTGYSEAELVTMNVVDLLPPEIELGLFPKVAKNESGKRVLELMKKNGSRFIAEISGYPIKLEEQLLVLGIVRDITEQKQFEEKLRESEMTARALLDASTESAFLIDTDGTYLQMNEVTAKRLDKDIEDLLGECNFNFFPPEIAKSRKKIVKDIVLNKEPVRFQDERLGRIFDNSLNPIIDAEGNVVRIAIFARDVTKQKQAEEALRASEQKYKLLAENSTDVIYKINIENEQYSYASPSAERIFGYTNKEILDLKASETITPESYAYQREKLEAATLQGKNEPEILELEVRHKDGRVIPVEVHARILFDQQGVPKEILGIARDITWRKEAESALKKSEERYKFLAENMGDVVWTVDMDLNTTYISPSVEKVFGYTPEEREKQTLEAMVTPESLDHIRSILVKELERDKLSDIDPDRFITIEVEYYHRDGIIIWMENQIKAIRNQAGEIIGIYGVSRDITDRKRAEEIIRESREKLRSIVEHANELFYIHNLDHELTYVSPASMDILGYAPKEMMRKWTELASDNPINQKGLEITEKAMMTGQRQTPYLLELTKKDGTLIMLEINESPIKDSQGKVVGITGAARDVTDKIRAEQALKKAHDELDQKVKERTRELSIANENMQQEIRERKMAEESLHEQEEKLKLQASRLEEMNTALKILIEHREDEKTELKENVLLNMEKLVMPHLDKLASSIPNGQDNTYLNIIRANLEGLVSPFAQELSSRRLNLTPTQMQIADFIRNGFTNKEIASHLNISVDAVSFHRKNIRKRLGLTTRKANLRSYLQQLPNIKR